MSDSDEQLMRRLKVGDKRAFTIIWRRYETYVRNSIGKMLNSYDCALVDDIMQMTALTLWRRRGANWQGRCALKSWLYTIAQSEIRMYLREQARKGLKDLAADLDELVVIEDSEDDPENVLYMQEVAHHALKALNSTGTAENRAIYALYRAGTTAPILAEYTGRSPACIKSRIIRFREEYRKRLKVKLTDQYNQLAANW